MGRTGLAAVLPFLRCPHCGAPLAQSPAAPQEGNSALRCRSGHSFDVAGRGYVNLATGHRHPPGDSAPMVAARAAFLAGGHFEAITRCVCEQARGAVGRASPALVVDVGAGTGHLLARVLDELPHAAGLALDSSTHALRRAAHAHERIGAVGCDAWGALPVADGVAQLVVNAFAPRNGEEIARVLAHDGTALVVTPTSRHLGEIVAPLGLLSVDERKADRLRQRFAGRLVAVRETACETTMSLRREEIAQLVGMGPSNHHVAAGVLRERLDALPEPLDVTASVSVAAYVPRASAVSSPA